jgi:hypothetical protein
MSSHHFGNGNGRSRAFDGGSAEGTEIDGLRVMFDQKVGLYPANLQKKSQAKLPPIVRAPGRLRAGSAYAH